MSWYSRATIVEKHKVGSRVTCNPPPVGTDDDTLVYTNSSDFEDGLRRDGWTCDTSDAYANIGVFTSYKKGGDNYIVTRDTSFRDKFLLATRVATKLNLMRKEDRVALFQALLYGNG